MNCCHAIDTVLGTLHGPGLPHRARLGQSPVLRLVAVTFSSYSDSLCSSTASAESSASASSWAACPRFLFLSFDVVVGVAPCLLVVLDALALGAFLGLAEPSVLVVNLPPDFLRADVDGPPTGRVDDTGVWTTGSGSLMRMVTVI